MDEFLFYKVGGRRNRTESLHDLLVVAKNGLKKTRIMHEANLTWYLMIELLKFAEAAELVEEVEVPKYELYGSIRSPAIPGRQQRRDSSMQRISMITARAFWRSRNGD